MVGFISRGNICGGHVFGLIAAVAVFTTSELTASPDFIRIQTAPEKVDIANNKPPKDFSKKNLITPLLDQLARTTEGQTAKVIAEAVSKLWTHSGSPTVDLLMTQVSKAMAANKIDKALALSDMIVEIAPGFAEGWNRRATVLYMQRSYGASMADIGKVLELEPRHFGALSGLGLVLQALGDKKAALEAFRKALKVHPFLKGPRSAVKKLEPEVEGRGI